MFIIEWGDLLIQEKLGIGECFYIIYFETCHEQNICFHEFDLCQVAIEHIDSFQGRRLKTLCENIFLHVKRDCFSHKGD